jgi:hypothetical protein
MSIKGDAYMNELAGNSWKMQDEQERLMASRADTYWIKKNFGDHIKITGNLIFAKTPEDFLKEIDRQNKKLMEEPK